MIDDCIVLDSSPEPEADAQKFNRPRLSCSQPILGLRNSAADFLKALSDSDSENEVSTQAAALISPKKKRTKKAPSAPDEFFGVYCLISRSPLKHYKNRCYIGYTVDPNRRITQHNGGREKGGAKKTDNRGPWDMVCIIHGFPNSVAALRFEWAWQNPDSSKAIKHLNLKKSSKETPFAFRIRIACHLLNSFPWKRFALTFRWLLVNEKIPFPKDIPPPVHTKMAHGLVQKTATEIPLSEQGYIGPGMCVKCHKSITELNHLVRCLRASCGSHFHSKCLAEFSIQAVNDNVKDQLFPLEAKCFVCSSTFLWGDVVRDQRMILKVDECKEESKFKGLVPKFVA